MVYKVTVKFKKGIGDDLIISCDSKENIKEIINKNYTRKKNPLHSNVMQIGDLFVSSDDILWIKVEGDKKIEESLGK